MEKLRYERPIIKKLNTGSINKFGTQTKNEVVSHLEGGGGQRADQAIRFPRCL